MATEIQTHEKSAGNCRSPFYRCRIWNDTWEVSNNGIHQFCPYGDGNWLPHLAHHQYQIKIRQ
jgi:hypothetical protein